MSTCVCTKCVQSMEMAGVNLWVNREIPWMFPRRMWILWIVDLPTFRTMRTSCTQVFRIDLVGCALHIQLLPDLGNLLAYDVIKLDSFFNLFDGVDGCCMILAPQFVGDLRKA